MKMWNQSRKHLQRVAYLCEVQSTTLCFFLGEKYKGGRQRAQEVEEEAPTVGTKSGNKSSRSGNKAKRPKS